MKVKLHEEWVEKAEVFLKEAERQLKEGIFWLSCFSSHQAAEFYLMSLIVAITGFHPYTHDLSELLDALTSAGIEVDDEVRVASEILTPHYTLSRYPGKRTINYSEGRASRCLECSRTIVEWVKRVADP